jgi:hypothetical protein
MEKEQAADIIRASSLSGHADVLIGQLMPSARLIVKDEPASHLAGAVSSHLQGSPSLPAGGTWPAWNKRDYLKGHIARLESRFNKNPQARILRDGRVARMREELAHQPQAVARQRLGACTSGAAVHDAGEPGQLSPRYLPSTRPTSRMMGRTIR